MLRLLPCLAVLLTPTTASADWIQWSGGSGPTLVDVSSPDGQHVVVGGFTVEFAGGYIPTVTNYVRASSDGGRTFHDVTGDLSGAPLEGIRAVFFVDAETGFVVIGSELHRTATGGHTWTATDVRCAAQRIWFHDARVGALTCPGGQLLLTDNGGASFRTVATGVGTDLNRMFWLDAERGWISTYGETEDGQGNVEYTDGKVLRTNDGGATWSPSQTIDGRGLGELFFLDDGRTGWLTAWTWVNAERKEARLFRTADGGETFADAGLPIQVGTIQSIISGPLNTYGIHAMYWADEFHGHLGGAAYIMTINNSKTGEEQYWRNVDYITGDGGATWEMTELGVIEVDVFGGGTLENDGVLLAGHLTGLYTGWMVGDQAAVWGYEHICTSDGECGHGSVCDAGTCVPVTDPEGPGDPTPEDGDSGTTGRAKTFAETGCAAARGSAAVLLLALLWARLRARLRDRTPEARRSPATTAR